MSHGFSVSMLFGGALVGAILCGVPGARGQQPALPDTVPPSTAPATDATERTPRYAVTFSGFDAIGLDDRMKQLSILWANRRSRPDSLAQLRRRIAEDVASAERLLQSEGYYAGRVRFALDRQDSGDNQVEVIITAEPGPRYLLRSVEIKAPAGVQVMVRDILALAPGQPATAQAMLDAEARLRVELPRRGHPFVEVGARDVVVDHGDAGVSYELAVDTGPLTRFGPLEFTGEEVLRPRHIARLARFKAGEIYDQRRVDDFREALLSTGLFAEAAVAPRLPTGASRGDAEVAAPVVLRTEAAKRRSIGLSVGYGSGSGPKAEATWQHRNLFGAEERLTLLGRVGTQEQLARANLQKSNFRRRDNALISQLEIAHETPDAYETYRGTFSIGIERETDPIWQKRWVYSLSAETSIERIQDAAGERTYLLLAAPATLRYDSTDDLFDPTAGFRAFAIVTPQLAEQGGVFTYLKTELGGSYYRPLDAQARFVAAGRVRVGSIVGAGRDRIAANRRFFAGGGGSVRGFSYQNVGEQSADGTPLGGRAISEVGAELRWRVTERFGIVPFLDGGIVTRDSTPTLSGFRWGAGLGLRYYTDFAPIRVDVATPLGRRPGEQRLLLYVSIGQSF